MALTKASGSLAPTPYRTTAISRLPISETMAPAVRPMATGRRLSVSSSPSTAARLAPTARRTPISRVRCPVTNVSRRRCRPSRGRARARPGGGNRRQDPRFLDLVLEPIATSVVDADARRRASASRREASGAPPRADPRSEPR